MIFPIDVNYEGFEGWSDFNGWDASAVVPASCTELGLQGYVVDYIGRGGSTAPITVTVDFAPPAVAGAEFYTPTVDGIYMWNDYGQVPPYPDVIEPITITWEITDIDDDCADVGGPCTDVTLRFYYAESDTPPSTDLNDPNVDWFTIGAENSQVGEYGWDITQTYIQLPSKDVWLLVQGFDCAGNMDEQLIGPFTIWVYDYDSPPTVEAFHDFWPYIPVENPPDFTTGFTAAPADFGFYDAGTDTLWARAEDDESGILQVQFYYAFDPGPQEGDCEEFSTCYDWDDFDWTAVGELLTERTDCPGCSSQQPGEDLDPAPYFATEVDWNAEFPDVWPGDCLYIGVQATNGIGMTSNDYYDTCIYVYDYTSPMQAPLMGRPLDGSIVSGRGFEFFGFAWPTIYGTPVEVRWYYWDDGSNWMIPEGFTPHWERLDRGRPIHGSATELEEGPTGIGEFTTRINVRFDDGEMAMLDPGVWPLMMCAMNPMGGDVVCTDGNLGGTVPPTPETPIITAIDDPRTFQIWLNTGDNLVSTPLNTDQAWDEVLYEYSADRFESPLEAAYTTADDAWRLVRDDDLDVGEWEGWDAETGLGDFYNAQDGEGYWVEMNYEAYFDLHEHFCTMYGWNCFIDPDYYWHQASFRGIEGPEPGPMGVPDEYDMYAGWNLAGFTPEDMDDTFVVVPPPPQEHGWIGPYPWFPTNAPYWDYSMLEGCMYVQEYLDESLLFNDIRAVYIYDTWDNEWMALEILDFFCPGDGFWLALENGGTIYP
jgi:hypothetical protein